MKRKRGGNFDFERRLELRKVRDSKQKMCQILAYFDHIPQDSTEMTNGARHFALCVIVPIVSCLRNHCNGNIDEFLKVVAFQFL